MNANSNTDSRRILIVDDNTAIHDDYRKILDAPAANDGLDELSALMFGEQQATSNIPRFELQSAYQGEQALEQLETALSENRPFAMAFVDMRMPPGWDGLQTIEHLWQADPRLQVVICTAYSDYSWSEMIERVAHRDRFLILKKPFDNIEVCQLAIALTQKWELERLAEERMVSIVETAADGIITFCEDGTIESCNGASCELFGCDRGELLGSSFANWIADCEHESWGQCLRATLSAGEGTKARAQDLAGRRRDGTRVPLLVSVSEFSAEDGLRFTAILRDLTEYKRLQAELAQAQKLESIGQLAAGIAHEINTPMQFIGQNIEFLDRCVTTLRRVLDAYERNLEPEGEAKSWESRWQELGQVMRDNRFETVSTQLPKAIQESLEGVERVVGIVRAMREFSDSGQDEATEVDLNTAVQSAVTITRNRWNFMANVELDLQPRLPTVHSIGAEINHLLLNLIVNAADATAEKFGQDGEKLGAIKVRTWQESNHVVIEVADNGCGIPDEIKDRVFDPFFTTKDVGKGTGQGLATCYNVVVNRYGGTIEFASTPGEGTVFTVRLPCASALPSSSATGESAAAAESVRSEAPVAIS